jgi:hypothetical protein
VTGFATVLAGCGSAVGPTAEPIVAPGAAAPGTGDAAAVAELVIILPPVGGLAAEERVRVRMLVERAADEALPGAAGPVLLEPADVSAVAWTLEDAVRRVGASGSVCLIGADGAATIEPVLMLYPAARVCLLPSDAAQRAGTGPSRAHAQPIADVDLDRLGRELGAAARAAAGEDTVLLLSARDAMLDRRWRTGVIAGAPGPLHTVATAREAISLLDEQAEGFAAGVVPTSPQVQAGDRSAPLVPLPDRDDLPLALALPRISVVVLDASAEAAVLVGPLVERGLLVVGPRSLLAGLPDDGIVLRWRVRWDVPLTALLRSMGSGVSPSEASSAVEPVWEDVVVLEPGRAYVEP